MFEQTNSLPQIECPFRNGLHPAIMQFQCQFLPMLLGGCNINTCLCETHGQDHFLPMPHKHLDSQAEECLEVVFRKTPLQSLISSMPFSIFRIQ